MKCNVSCSSGARAAGNFACLQAIATRQQLNQDAMPEDRLPNSDPDRASAKYPSAARARTLAR
eukprot:2432068-Lingulodinium_polyedra.AAC.1